MSGEKRSKFDIGVWYMTKDYNNLYKIIYQKGTKQYSVIVYYSGSTMYYGNLYQVQSFMNDKCMNHDSYIRWCLLDGQ